MDRVFALEAVESGSIPGRVKPKTVELVLKFSCFLYSAIEKGQCEAFIYVVGRWQLDSKTAKVFCWLLAKATSLGKM